MAAHLLGRQVAAVHAHVDGREALLALGAHVRGPEALELGVVAVGLRVGAAGLGRVGLLVVDHQQRRGVEVALVDPVALELLVDHLAERVHADLVHQHLDPRAGAVHAQEVLAVEDAEDGLGDLQVVAVVQLHEVVERGGDARHDRRAAAHADLDALGAVLAHAREEGDVVDAGDGAVGVRGGERRLDLARHQLRGGVAHEVAHVRAGPRGHVERLVVAHAGVGVAGHVAHGVATALARGQARRRQLADQLRPSASAGCGGSGCSGAS